MPSDRKLRVMISSRCAAKVKWNGKSVPMTDLRREMKQRIEGYQPFGAPLFECWINEDSPPQSPSMDVWEICRDQARKADILLVLYNGDPGWSVEKDGIGICQAELMAGLSSSPDKVYAIRLPEVDLPKEGDPSRNAHGRFREFFKEQIQFSQPVDTGEAALDLLPGTLHEALVSLALLGVRAAGPRRFTIGDALDWSRMDFQQRKVAMEAAARDALRARQDSYLRERQVFAPVHGIDMLFAVHAIPGPVSTPAARELVGRPFHQDHQFAKLFETCEGECGGPLHIIACHRSVTEKQASDLLGQPDVYTVDGDFGVLAIDRISKAQCLFLRNCRDEATTWYAVQRAFDWLERSEEDRLVAERGLARKRILAAIAQEN